MCISVIVLGVLDVSADISKAITTIDSGTCGSDLTWQLNSSGVLSISGSGKMSDYSEDSTAPWYSNRSTIKSISISNTLTHIGSYAFSDCTELTNISVSSQVTSIGRYAFRNCTNLSGAKLSDNILTLSDGVFSGCKALRSITLPNKITKINDCMFYDSGIEEIVVPDSVKRIGDSAFAYCFALKSIMIPDSVDYIETDAFLYSKNIENVYINNLTSWLNIVFCSSEVGSGYSNPISNGANLVLDSKVLTEVAIPNTVTEVKKAAFYKYQMLKKLVIPSSVSIIGKSAFEGCTNLEYAQVSSSTLGVQSFYECTKLKKIILDGELWYVPQNAFGHCINLSSVDIPDTVTLIDTGAFYGCTSLSDIKIPQKIRKISVVAFSQCTSIKKVYISDLSAWLNATLEGYADPFAYGAEMYLNGSLITHLIVPDDATILQNIGNCSSIESIYLHKNVNQVNGMSNNLNIKKVYAPISKNFRYDFNKDVTFVNYCTIDYIKDGTLIKSDSVYVGEDSVLPIPPTGETYYYESNGEEWNGKNVSADTSVTVYNAALVTYTGDYVGNDIVKIGSDIVLPTAVDGIYYFEHNGDEWFGINITENILVDVILLKSFDENKNAGWNLKNGILRIGGAGYMPDSYDYPWSGKKTQIKEIKIGDEILNIGRYAFDSCENLVDVKIGNKVMEIGTEAFDDCANISSIVIPDSVKGIGEYAFEDCYNLKSVKIGKGLEVIENKAFRYNETVEYIIDDGNPYFKTVDGHIYSKDGTKLVRYAIGNTNTEYNISDGVTTIGFSAFESAVNLKTVRIPTSVTNIEGDAFWLVDSYLKRHYLDGIFYDGSKSQWDKINVSKNYNYALEQAEIHFSKYDILIKDENGNTIKSLVVDGGKTLSDEDIPIKIGYSYKLCTDNTLLTEYDLNTPVTSDITLYIKYNGTKTMVSSDGKTFNIKPAEIAKGNTVILALYNGKEFSEMQSKVYDGTDILFTTDKTYTSAMVMVWSNIDNMEPICDVEIVK